MQENFSKMTEAISAKKAVNPVVFQGKAIEKPRKISWPDFQKKYLDREDGFKYEWVDGEVVKSKHMDYKQFFIVRNLMDAFDRLRALGKFSGRLMPEGDIFFGEKHRRPDVAYLTEIQIDRTAYGINQVPQFVVEVISSKDQMNVVNDKMKNYRDSGVAVVWHIFPLSQQVHVYSGQRLKKMTVCEGEDICSAAPVLPDFELTTNAVFQKPPMPENLAEA